MLGLGAAVRICAVANAVAKKYSTILRSLKKTKKNTRTQAQTQPKMGALKIIGKDYLCENSIGCWRYAAIYVCAFVWICL